MIFNTDTTVLSSNVAMAEGYDCSIGTALALIDSARNDGAMFEAMLGIEAKACQLESAGYTNESGELVALQEAAAGGILKKIAELFKKLAEKIKSIFHTFFSKINSLFMSDKQMVKKYEKEILRKTNLGKLEIKWRRIKNEPDCIIRQVDQAYKNAKWSEDREDRESNMYDALGYGFIDVDDVHGSYVEHHLDDEEKDELSAFKLTSRGILNSLSSDMPKMIKKAQTDCDKLINLINKEAKECNKNANEYADTSKNKDYKETEMTELNHKYDMAVVYQDCQTKINGAYIDVLKIIYKQTKAAFMKMISANDKKLEESAIWDETIAEAAENEVEDVLTAAISKEDLSETNNASMAVKDADVSDDPNKLVYSDDPDYKRATTDGSIDSCIAGRCKCKNEAAFFGEML